MAEIAFLNIKGGILKGTYPPETKLIPANLEKELGLGRIAIREALKELSGLGLVVLTPNKEARVAHPPTIEEIKEIFEIRCLLEGKAAQLATPQISLQTVQGLEELHLKMSTNPIPFEDYFFLNREFHLKIYSNSGWSYLCRVIAQLIEQVQSFRSRYPFEPQDFYSFNKDHQKILEAIRDVNPEKVRELIVTNIQRGFETLIKVYAKTA
jgi:DNA-binding GntR family transcriptional regulator